MKRSHVFLAATALSLSTPVWAGEEPLYRPAPAWVELATMPAVKAKSGTPILIYDIQQRIEAGRLTAYQDRAVRLDDPQTVTAAGTIGANWLPDKGDLLVHEVSILRGGEKIDVLAQGGKFAVLRREESLEQRALTGAMTATMTVPGLRVGDVLRIRYSTTTSDQTLKQEVQAMAQLPAAPFAANQGRVQMSWPAAAPVQWKVVGPLKVEPVVKDGYRYVTVALPLAKPDDLPDDVPARYRMPQLIQAGTFQDWQSISRLMAPLYAQRELPAALAAEAARIKAASRDPLTRATLALQLVQDQVSYFMNGLNGGNYQPQSAAETWDKRYGDCKAKTLLLLTLLKALDVEGEAVTVASQTGDALPGLLPMPADFDHVLVRARIAGKDYWLDGTSAGATLQRVGDVPAFAYGLPLRTAGAGLEPIVARAPSGYDAVARITADHRAGLDLPMLFSGEWSLSGPLAATLQAAVSQGTPDQLRDMIGTFVTEQMGAAQVYDTDVAYDDKTRVATIKASGLMTSPWRWDRTRGSRPIEITTSQFEFKPDRSRKAWQALPVALPGPESSRNELTVLLPPGTDGYRLEGRPELDATVGGIHLVRHARLAGDRLTLDDAIEWPGGELPAERLAEVRGEVGRLGTLSLALVAPSNAERRYTLAKSSSRARTAPIEAAYAKLIALDPDSAENYLNRAAFRVGTFDRLGALADMDKAIELDPAAASYARRAALYRDLDKLELALADADKWNELAPSIEAALYRSNIMGLLGRASEALGVLHALSPSSAEEDAVQLAISEIEAAAGRKADGLALVEKVAASRGSDIDVLNSRCWYRATWNVDTEAMLDLCTKAVEQAGGAPAVLDSRAMAYFRLGRYAEALKDLDSALAGQPDLAPSLFMRGVVRQAMGDKASGTADITEALARQPSLARDYARFGIRPL